MAKLGVLLCLWLFPAIARGLLLPRGGATSSQYLVVKFARRNHPAIAVRGGASGKMSMATALDCFDSAVSRGISSSSIILRPMSRMVRGIFGLSLLFYGEKFEALAYSIIIFRLTGYRLVVRHFVNLVESYKEARRAMLKAARELQDLQNTVPKTEKLLKPARDAMLEDERRIMADGKLTEEEKREFLDKYRVELRAMRLEQARTEAAKSSIKALRQSVNFNAISASLNGLYSSAVLSLTAASFKAAGQLTLALHCGVLLRRVLLDLLGPVVDPVGFRLRLDNYVATSEDIGAVRWIEGASLAAAIVLMYFMRRDTEHALKLSMIFLGARLCLEPLDPVFDALRRQFGYVVRRRESTPFKSVLHVLLAIIGYRLHASDKVPAAVALICKPFIRLLVALNGRLSAFKIATIDFLP